jgi:UDP-N-acetylglucosamine:LPS N-acetylglucosamine transferase
MVGKGRATSLGAVYPSMPWPRPRTLRGLVRVPLVLLRSFLIPRRVRPDVVVGVGGYASGSMPLAAALAGHATAIQEQSSISGLTNRVLGKLVAAVFIAFEDAARFRKPDRRPRCRRRCSCRRTRCRW